MGVVRFSWCVANDYLLSRVTLKRVPDAKQYQDRKHREACVEEFLIVGENCQDPLPKEIRKTKGDGGYRK